LHEISHFLAGIYSGCKEIKTVFTTPPFKAYTEMVCQPEAQYILPALAPIIFVTLFGILFLFLENMPERNFFWIIIGFNLIISVSDIRHFIPFFLIYSQSIGLILIIFGQFLFTNQIILLFMKRKRKKR
jgi:hypothetical protein